MALPNGLVYRNERWMYRSGRPNRMAALLNRAWARLASLGLGPSRLVALEVRGRRSGRPISFPLIVADWEGERYLVAMLGEHAAWVANVRATDGRAVLRRGRSEAVLLEEVAPGRRAPILRRHLQVAPAARSFVPVDHRAPIAEFEGVAAQFPVFRVRPRGAFAAACIPASSEGVAHA
jgi:F420H(2)-dependent quinone reductase